MPSYEKRKPSNLWSVRFRELADDGREVNKRLSGFKTKAEAQKAYKEYLKGYTHHVIQPAEQIVMFEDLYVRFMEWHKTRVKESSYYSAMSKIQAHILPYFGKMRIADIKPNVILSWRRTLAPFSFAYKSSIDGYLGSMFIFANRYFDLPNPMVKVDPMRNLEPKREMNIWTYEEFQQFISVVDDDMYRCLFRFYYASGCRRGEALALSFDDIDVENNIVSINKNLTRKTKEGAYKITSPKNHSSYRKLQLPATLIADMLSLKKSDDDVFVFGGTAPIADNTLTRRFYKWIKEAGVKRIVLHGLRHSCASLLISKGLSVVAVSKWLGHSNINETLNTYSHMLPADSERVTEVFLSI